MGQFFVNAAGEKVYVGDSSEEISNAVANGYKPTKKINYTTSTGQAIELAPEDAAQQFSTPGTVAEFKTTSELDRLQAQKDFEAEYGGAFGTGRALLEGGASALTLGGYDAINEALGGEADKYARANPYARLTGEIVGGIAPALATGGESVLAKFLAKTPAGLVTGLGESIAARGGLMARTAGMAAEGFGYGVGQGISNIALSDHEYAADAAVGELLTQGLIGGVLGGGTGLITESLTKVGQRYGSKALAAEEAAAKEASDVAERTAQEGLGQLPLTREERTLFGAKSRAGFADMDNVARDVAKTAVPADVPQEIASLPARMVESMAQSRQVVDDVLADLTLRQDSKMLAKVKNSSHMKNMAEAKKALRELYGQNEIIGRSGILDAGAQKVIAAEPRNFRKTAELLDTYRQEALAIEKMVGTTDSLRGLHTKFDPHDYVRATATGSWDDLIEKFAQSKEFENLTGKLDELANNVKTSWGIKGKEFKLDGEAFGKFLTINDPQKAIKAAEDLRAYTKHLDDIMEANKLHVTPEQLANFTNGKQVLAEAFNDVLKKGGPEITGKSGMDLATGLGLFAVSETDAVPELDGPADEIFKLWIINKFLHGKGQKVAATAEKSAAKAAQVAEKRGALEGFEKTLKNAASYAGFKQGRDTAAHMGASNSLVGNMVKGMGGAAGATVARKITDLIAGGSDNVLKIMGATRARTYRAVEQLAKGGAKVSRIAAPTALAVMNQASFGAEPKKGKTLREAYKLRTDEIMSIAADPLAFQTRLNESLTEIAKMNPQFADSLEIATMRTLNYIAQIWPKDPRTIQVMGKSRWQPSDAQLISLSRSLAGAFDPVGSLERCVNGSISPEEGEALRVCHPEIANSIRTALITKMPDLAERMSRDQRMKLGILMKLPTDSTLDPDFVKFMQNFHTTRQEAQKEQPMNPKALQPNEPTEAQKLQGR